MLFFAIQLDEDRIEKDGVIYEEEDLVDSNWVHRPERP